jgi:hypothetical protein
MRLGAGDLPFLFSYRAIFIGIVVATIQVNYQMPWIGIMRIRAGDLPSLFSYRAIFTVEATTQMNYEMKWTGIMRLRTGDLQSLPSTIFARKTANRMISCEVRRKCTICAHYPTASLSSSSSSEGTTLNLPLLPFTTLAICRFRGSSSPSSSSELERTMSGAGISSSLLTGMI